MEQKVYHFPKFIRIWHAINALSVLILIITGVGLQYYSRDNSFIPFKTLIDLHDIFGVILVINYLIFLIGNFITPNGKHYRLFWKGFSKELLAQAKYYLIGMFKNEKHPFPINESRKFNPLQKVSYTVVMYIFVPLILVTGLGLLFPEIVVVRKMFNYSGILVTDIFHIISGFIISLFLIVHLYLCTIGIKKHNTFKSIVDGWHYKDE